MGIHAALHEDGGDAEHRPDSWRPTSDEEEEEELLASSGASPSRRNKPPTGVCTGVAAFAVVAVLFAVLALPRGGAPSPEKLVQEPADSGEALLGSDPADMQRMPLGPTQVKLCTYDGATPYCPTSELWLTPEVQEQVARDIMADTGDVLGARDRDLVLAKVQFVFERISASLKLLDPTVEKELSMVEVNEAERTALLTALQLTNDPRVQAIGRDVGAAIRLSAAISPEKEFLMQQVESSLLHEYGSIQGVRRDVVPNALLKLWGQNEPDRLPSLAASKWQMTLEPPNVESMSISDEPPQLIEWSAVTSKDLAAVVEGAALVEGRYLLDLLLTCVRWLRPTWSTDLLGSLDFARLQLGHHCEPDPPAPTGDKVDLAQVVLCKLKFGAQGMDALRANFVTELMRNSTARNPLPQAG